MTSLKGALVRDLNGERKLQGQQQHSANSFFILKTWQIKKGWSELTEQNAFEFVVEVLIDVTMSRGANKKMREMTKRRE